MMAYKESGGIAPLLLNLDTRWTLVATPLEEEPLVPTALETGWAPQTVWTFWRTKVSCPCRGMNSGPFSL